MYKYEHEDKVLANVLTIGLIALFIFVNIIMKYL